HWALRTEIREHFQPKRPGTFAEIRTLMHARILLKADENSEGPRLTDDQIAEAVEGNRSTVERMRYATCWRALQQRSARSQRASCIRASWTEYRRRIWSRWRAVLRRKGVGAGRCGCLPTGLSNWKLWTTFRTRPCGRHLRKPTQALAETTVLPAR